MGTWTYEHWRDMLDISLVSTALVSQAFAENFVAKSGSIIYIAVEEAAKNSGIPSWPNCNYRRKHNH